MFMMLSGAEETSGHGLVESETHLVLQRRGVATLLHLPRRSTTQICCKASYLGIRLLGNLDDAGF